MENPFRPTAGATPPEVIGRTGLLDEFAYGLRIGSGAPGLLTIFTGARPLMQVVHILGDDQKLARPFCVQPGKRTMRCIRLHLLQPRPARIVEGLDQTRVAPERLRGCDILDPVPLPKAVRASERREAALGGYAGAGKDEDVSNLAMGCHFAGLALGSQGRQPFPGGCPRAASVP